MLRRSKTTLASLLAGATGTTSPALPASVPIPSASSSAPVPPSHARSASARPTTATQPAAPTAPGQPQPHIDLTLVPRDGELFGKLKSQFESKLQHKGSAETAWDDYSRLLDNMLDKVNVSIVSHHFLFRSISTTSANDTDDLASKAMLLDKIVTKLGTRAKTDEFAMLAEIYEKRGDLPKLRALVGRMRGMAAHQDIRSPHINIYNALIRLSLANKDFAAAVACFDSLRADELLRLSMPPSEPGMPVFGAKHSAPNSTTYLLLLRYYFDTNEHDTIDSLITEMKSRGVPVNAGIFEIQIKSCLRENDYAGVLAVFANVKQRYENLPSDSPLPSALASCYYAAISSFAKLGRLDDVVSLYHKDRILARLLKSDATEMAVRLLGYTTRDARFMNESFEIFENLVAQRSTGRGGPNKYAFYLMVAMCCRFAAGPHWESRIETALALMKRMDTEFGWTPTIQTYNAIVFTLAKHCTSNSKSADTWVAVLETKYAEMTKEYGMLAIQPDLHQKVISALISSNKLSAASESLTSLLQSSASASLSHFSTVRRFVEQAASTASQEPRNQALIESQSLLHTTVSLIQNTPLSQLHASLTTINDINATFSALIAALSPSNNLSACTAVFQDYKLLAPLLSPPATATVASTASLKATSPVVDSMLTTLLYTPSPASLTIPPFLTSLHYTPWKSSVASLIQICKTLSRPDLDDLIDAMDKQWIHRREVVVLKTVQESLLAQQRRMPIAGVEDEGWRRNGVDAEDVEEIQGFALEVGRACVL
ncbi:hypothetical protein HDU98_005957 [Podochytrium sp. JEL0797]|nr:hypothetical protein HDU98_005957 [Podochytrium sp. JEL0797]